MAWTNDNVAIFILEKFNCLFHIAADVAITHNSDANASYINNASEVWVSELAFCFSGIWQFQQQITCFRNRSGFASVFSTYQHKK